MKKDPYLSKLDEQYNLGEITLKEKSNLYEKYVKEKNGSVYLKSKDNKNPQNKKQSDYNDSEQKKKKNKLKSIINKLRGFRTGFKVGLLWTFLNIFVLTYWDKWGYNRYPRTFDLGPLGEYGTFGISFSNDTFELSLGFLFIYWVLWGYKK